MRIPFSGSLLFLVLYGFEAQGDEGVILGKALSEGLKEPFTSVEWVSITPPLLKIDLFAPEGLSPESLTPDDLDSLYRAFWEGVDKAGIKGVSNILIRAPDREGVMRRLSSFLRDFPLPEKGGADGRRSFPQDAPSERPGFLSGKVIFLSQSHGWYYNEDYAEWLSQRPNTYGISEDFHNAEAINQFLIQYLKNAGAEVITVREPDMNAGMVIIDNGEDGYTESGDAGFRTEEMGFGRSMEGYPYGTNPFENGDSRVFDSDDEGGGLVKWVPEIPEDGYYNLYVSYMEGEERVPDALYTVFHPGGATEFVIDQTLRGGTWVYLGNFYFRKGRDDALGAVTLSSLSAYSGTLSADAVRIGGGYGDVTREGTTSGQPRWEDAAIYYTQFSGAPPSVYDPYEDGDGSDPSSRSRFAAWLHEEWEDALYVSWHSNACDYCGANGTSIYVYGDDAFSGVEGSDILAGMILDSLIEMVRERWDPDWDDRGVRTAQFSEVSPNNNPETPAVLLEHGFHDSEWDARLIKSPLFRMDSARAIYHGIVDYFAERDGVEPVYSPPPPQNFHVMNSGPCEITLRWEGGAASPLNGGPPSAYIVYTSLDGRSFDNGTIVFGKEYIIEGILPYTLLFFKASAINEGGESFPTEVLAIRVGEGGRGLGLIVSGFDRLDSHALIPEYESSSLGTIYHMYTRRMNRYDYTVELGAALSSTPLYFDSASNEAAVAGYIDFTDYEALFWITGEESTVDESLSAEEQEILAEYLEFGGNLFISGSEIGWDLYEKGDAGDMEFYSDYLKAGYLFDDAGTYYIEPSPASIFSGLGGFHFDDGTHGYYDVDYPDVIAPEGDCGEDCETLLHYDGNSSLPGGLIYDGVFRLIYLGFPFETIYPGEVRDGLMKLSLERFEIEYPEGLGGPEGEELWPECAGFQASQGDETGCNCTLRGIEGGEPSGPSPTIFALFALTLLPLTSRRGKGNSVVQGSDQIFSSRSSQPDPDPRPFKRTLGRPAIFSTGHDLSGV